MGNHIEKFYTRHFNKCLTNTVLMNDQEQKICANNINLNTNQCSNVHHRNYEYHSLECVLYFQSYSIQWDNRL